MIIKTTTKIKPIPTQVNIVTPNKVKIVKHNVPSVQPAVKREIESLEDTLINIRINRVTDHRAAFDALFGGV